MLDYTQLMKNEIIVSVRMPKDLDERLKRVAESLDLTKNDVARHAIRAVVQAIESNQSLELPLKIVVQPQPLSVVLEKKKRRSSKEHS